MSDSPLDLDFKFLPDWLKEPEGKNPYADFPGETQDRFSRQDGRRGGGPRRGFGGPGDNRRPSGPSGHSGPRRSNDRQGGGGRDPQRPSPAARGDGRRGPQRPSGPHPHKGGPRPERQPRHEQEQAARSPQEAAAASVEIPLQVEFLPDPNATAALIQQIKTGGRAFPFYGVGRMFLNKPERHLVRITTLAPACPVFKVGEEGFVTLYRPAAQREAFRFFKDQYYAQETQESEPPKGNFANTARCRVSGVLLGPTNHHGYQVALRRLYEARFSRRVDFQGFLRQIEIVNDPEVVEAWKKQVSSTTVYRTTQEEEPKEFKTLAEVEAHFVATYQDKVVESAKSVEISGLASRQVSDRTLREAIRNAWEKERGFPAQLVNHLRPRFTEAGLTIWKHRKRLLYVSTVRPVRFGAEARTLSAEIGNLLNVIETKAKCTRADLSDQLLKPFEGEETFERRKATLASDLRWLIQSGHVIEFHDGTFDLPLAPKETEGKATQADAAKDAAPQEATVPATDAEATEAPVATEPTLAQPATAEAGAESSAAVSPVDQEGDVPASAKVAEGTAITEATSEVPENTEPSAAITPEAEVDKTVEAATTEESR